MKCPNCGNEISDNMKTCPICGLSFVTEKQKKSSNFGAFIGGFLLAVVVGTAGYYGYSMFQDSLGKNGQYQSITPMEKTTIEYLSSKEVLESLLEQENDLEEYLKKRRKPNINKVFETFYRNLSNSVALISDEGLVLVEKEEDSPWYKSSEPPVEFFEFSTNNITGTRIDLHYLNKKYAKYLNKDWQQYLKLAQENREKIWTSTDLSVSNKVIIDWVISWQRFLMKHPQFPLNDLVRAELKSLTTNILYHEYAFDNEKMTSETKIGYEEFLKRVNSTTKEYKIVKKCYNELKKNDYKTSADFYRYLSEYSKLDWHKEMFKTFQEKEDAKQFEAKETHKKVGNHLYFDEKSLQQIDGKTTGVFKQYIYSGEKQNGQRVIYKTISIGAFCDTKSKDGERKLELPVYKFYNIDEIIVSKTDVKLNWKKTHPNDSEGFTHPEEEENGEVYFKTLCAVQKPAQTEQKQETIENKIQTSKPQSSKSQPKPSQSTKAPTPPKHI